MKTINAGEAEKTLKELLEETAASHEPIQIISEPSNGILISRNTGAPYTKLYTCSLFRECANPYDREWPRRLTSAQRS